MKWLLLTGDTIQIIHCLNKDITNGDGGSGLSSGFGLYSGLAISTSGCV